MSTTAVVVTDTSTTGGATTTMATASPQATQITHSPSVFSSSSLLFGLIFMAVLIVFMAVGFTWQRIVLGRHRTLMSLVERVQETTILQSKPKIWDTHVGLRNQERKECWKDLKPLAVRLLPRSSSLPKSGQRQRQSDAAPTPPHPSVLRRFLDWLDPRPFYNPLIPSPPPNIVLPPSVIHPRKVAVRKGGKGDAKGKDRGALRKSRTVDRTLGVSVVIAMPTPRRGHAGAPQTVVAPLPPVAEEPHELYYELGVAHVPLRFQTSHPSPSLARDEKDTDVDDDDYESFLDELFDDDHDHDHVYNYRDKDGAVNVNVNIVRISR